MSQDLKLRLGSVTSGVDGASEGGRINTNNVPGALALYAVSLREWLRARGLADQVAVTPELTTGGWRLKVIYQGPVPDGVPELWAGRQVLAVQAPPQPEAGQHA